jgi:hypothetical protein
MHLYIALGACLADSTLAVPFNKMFVRATPFLKLRIHCLPASYIQLRRCSAVQQQAPRRNKVIVIGSNTALRTQDV